MYKHNPNHHITVYFTHFPLALVRPQSVNAEDAHREVQMNAISGLNQARQSTPILVVSYLIWNILEVAAIAIVLGMLFYLIISMPYPHLVTS